MTHQEITFLIRFDGCNVLLLRISHTGAGG